MSSKRTNGEGKRKKKRKNETKEGNKEQEREKERERGRRREKKKDTQHQNKRTLVHVCIQFCLILVVYSSLLCLSLSQYNEAILFRRGRLFFFFFVSVHAPVPQFSSSHDLSPYPFIRTHIHTYQKNNGEKKGSTRAPKSYFPHLTKDSASATKKMPLSSPCRVAALSPYQTPTIFFLRLTERVPRTTKISMISTPP